MSKQYKKAVVAAIVLGVLGGAGYGADVLGYGGGGGGRHPSQRSDNKPTVTLPETPEAPATTTVPVSGEVLGEGKFTFNNDLSMGMENNDVRELQERLRAEGFFTFHTSTGYFGPITFAAVKAYQAAHPEIGYVTGFFGPLTRAVINK